MSEALHRALSDADGELLELAPLPPASVDLFVALDARPRLAAG